MWYYYIRIVLRWVCRKLSVQCSGKYRSGYALTYCKHDALHEGVCEDYRNQPFHDNDPLTLKVLASEVRTNYSL